MKILNSTTSSLPSFAKALAGGIGLASLGVAPIRANALEEPAYGGGVYVGATFGDGKRTRFNYGLEARATAMPSFDSCDNDVTFWSGGGVARLDISGTKGRIVLGALGSGTAFLAHATAELGIGIRLYEPGLDFVVGTRLGLGPFSLRVDRTFNLQQWHVGGGLGIHGEWTKAMTSLTCIEGRPLRDEHGRMPSPQGHLADVHVASAEALSAAHVWLRRTRAEWASVAAFLELAEQLRVAGATDVLVQGALRAAQDEVRHTVLAASVVRACTGRWPSLAPIRVQRKPEAHRQQATIRLAVESWLDGCINEGVAALAAKTELLATRAPAAVVALSAIAPEEAMHQALAWKIVAWACQTGGDEVRHALWDAARTLATPASEPHAQGLEAWGCAGPGIQAKAIADVIENAHMRLAHAMA